MYGRKQSNNKIISHVAVLGDLIRENLSNKYWGPSPRYYDAVALILLQCAWPDNGESKTDSWIVRGHSWKQKLMHLRKLPSTTTKCSDGTLLIPKKQYIAFHNMNKLPERKTWHAAQIVRELRQMLLLAEMFGPGQTTKSQHKYSYCAISKQKHVMSFTCTT